MGDKKLCPICCTELITEYDEWGSYLICPECNYPFAEDTETYEMKHLSDAYPLSNTKANSSD